MAGYMKDLGNGKFQFEVSKGHTGRGKRNKAYRTITAKGKTPEAREKYAEKQLALFVAEVENGQHQKPVKFNFEELFERWINSHQGDKKLAPKTESRYRKMFNSRIKEYFNSFNVEKITALDIDAFFTELRSMPRLDGKPGNLDERTIKHHYRLISAIFAYAHRKQILRTNPMEFTERVDVKKKQVVYFEEDQISMLIDALDELPEEEFKYKVIIHLAIAGGYRLGEVVGLTNKNINFENKSVKITKSAQYVTDVNKKKVEETFPELLSEIPDLCNIINTENNIQEETLKYLKELLDRNIIIKLPKNESSVREIFMPSFVMDLLSTHQHIQKIRKVKLANKWKDTNWIFTDDFGDIMHPQTPSKWFHKFIVKHNNKILNDETIPQNEKKKYLLNEVPFHGLRHTSASYLISCGQDVASISERLGHANKNTTLTIYAHAFKKRDEEAARHMNKLYSKKETKDNKAK